jgi:hypothetical protein
LGRVGRAHEILRFAQDSEGVGRAHEILRFAQDEEASYRVDNTFTGNFNLPSGVS